MVRLQRAVQYGLITGGQPASVCPPALVTRRCRPLQEPTTSRATRQGVFSTKSSAGDGSAVECLKSALPRRQAIDERGRLELLAYFKSRSSRVSLPWSGPLASTFVSCSVLAFKTVVLAVNIYALRAQIRDVVFGTERIEKT